MNHPYTSIYF